MDAVKPDIILLAEASKPELMKRAFDVDYGWPLFHVLDDVVINGEPATAIRNVIDQQRVLFPKGTLHMLISDDHDELRAVARYGYRGAIAVSALLITLDGVPLIYNGMEVGDATPRATQRFLSRRRFSGPRRIGIRRSCPCRHEQVGGTNIPRCSRARLSGGNNSDEQHVVTFCGAGTEEFLVAVNLSNTPFRGTAEAEGQRWKAVDVPLEQNGEASPPFVALDAFEFRIFQKDAQH